MAKEKDTALDSATEANVKIWMEGDIEEAVKTEIRHLLETSPQEITDAFYTKLSFGTGGLRGVMGIGTNRMNKYTIRMATQGLANYINKQYPSDENRSVFIGYDSRHNSPFFAQEAAKVLAANQIRAYVCSEIRPTPLVSFGCRLKKCSAAIMITASHNPPEYNGYKVYWNDGGQVLPPHDEGIIREVQTITDLTAIKTVPSVSHPLIEKVGKEIDEEYLQAVEPYQSYPKENAENGSQLSIIYSSLHGTGITLVPQILKEWGFTNFKLVEKQCIPDGDFPTVKSPNPEEREALTLGIEEMMETGADILIATDPDGDRVGIAVKHEGEAVLLNGNQIACVCLYHLCKALSSQGRMPENAAFIKTIATTELFREIAESFGARCFDVLTGFKYVAEMILKWETEQNGCHYVFGGEESYGYLLGTHSRDKDAIISSALISEAALHAKLEGKTLVDLLNEIYLKFGVYTEKLLSLKYEESKAGREQMANGVKKLYADPPKNILGVSVLSIENYHDSVKTDLVTAEKTALTLPKSDAILFWLEDKTKILIRPSGTEPKIKIYCHVVQKDFEDLSQARQSCEKRAQNYLDALSKYLWSKKPF